MKLSLRVKLMSSFLVILSFMGAVSLTGYLALDGASVGFKQYREMARDANLAGRLQANMLMVRMNVKDFIITGSDKDQQQYRDYLDKMVGFLKEAQEEINAPERAKKVDQIDEFHLEYDASFHKVTQLQSEISELVTSVFTVRGPEAEQALTSIMKTAEADGDAVATYHAGLALRHLLLARLYTQKYMATHEQSTVDRVQAEFINMQEQLDTLEQELQNTERREWLAEASAAKDDYLAGFTSVVQAESLRNTIIHDSLDRIGPTIASLVEDVKLDIKGVQDKIGPQLQAANDRAVSMIVLASLIALLAGVALVYYIIHSVQKMLGGDPSEIAEVARRIAQGDLTYDFGTGGQSGRTGVYADMESMSSNLKTMFSDIADGVKTLTSSAIELSGISSQMNQGAAQASSQSGNVASASEEMSMNMNSVAASMEEASTNVSMVAAAAEQMSSTVTEIAKNSERANLITVKAVSTASKASDKVGDLGESANKIGKVIETITDISEQVNLLALNATIEAARAGEAGKGFAVVANEIKDLAKQTADATGLIKDSIQSVQASANVTVGEIHEISSVITDVSDMVSTIATAVEEQSVTTSEIAENTNQASVGISEVAENIAQSSSAAKEITEEIADISSSVNEINSSSNQVETSAKDLSQLAEQLRTMVSQFRVV